MEMAVSATTGAMNSVVGKLAGLLEGEYNLLKGVRTDIEILREELSTMNSVLLELANTEELDAPTKEWRDKVREMSYDIEDCIDLFVHHLGREDDAEKGFVKKMMRKIIKKLSLRHQIAEQIQELKARVHEESVRRPRYKIEAKPSPDAAATRAVTIDPRFLPLLERSKNLVGIDGRRDKVIRLLMDEEKRLKVVSVIGGGGLGKTTLATEVCNSVGGEFHCQASSYVSRNLDLKRLLEDLLRQIDKDKCKRLLEDMHGTCSPEQLIRELQGCLKDKRYLIIIDDIWNKEHWELVKAALPNNNNGSRIITTTRNTTVATSCLSSSEDHIYEMTPLNESDSRILFFQTIFRSDSTCPPHLEEVSSRILKKCGGLPLAISNIAGMLVGKPKTRNQWEAVLDSIGSTTQEGSDMDIMEKILFLSYSDLSPCLKNCLLYLSIYPEDYRIDANDLIWRWIAEGFIAEQKRSTLMQIAENHFYELISRNMIQAVDIQYDGTVEACRVHDVVLDYIISLSTKENFTTILDGQEDIHLTKNIRRLSLQSDHVKHEVFQKTSHIRSIGLFVSKGKHVHQLYGRPISDLCSYFPELHALRVLDLSGCYQLESPHISNIGSLFQLRYLTLASPNITKLPKQIGNLYNLQTLDVRGCSITELPSTLTKLNRLVRLSTRDCTWPDEIGKMENLEELSEACFKKTMNPKSLAEQLGKLTRLRELRIDYSKYFSWVKKDSEKDYNVGTDETNRALLSSLHTLGNLQNLYITVYGTGLFPDQLLESGVYFAKLEKLVIGSHIMRIPKEITSFANLHYLYIALDGPDNEDLRVLGAMPTLFCLEITSTPKEELIVNNHGFRHLLKFYLSSLHGVKMEFLPGAMPELLQLDIGVFVAKEEQQIPGLEHLSSLQQIKVGIKCDGANRKEVEDLEATMRKAAAKHPKKPTLTMWRSGDDRILKEREDDAQEDIKAGIKKRTSNLSMDESDEEYTNITEE